jgi:hypothetical protein
MTRYVGGSVHALHVEAGVAAVSGVLHGTRVKQHRPHFGGLAAASPM